MGLREAARPSTLWSVPASDHIQYHVWVLEVGQLSDSPPPLEPFHLNLLPFSGRRVPCERFVPGGVNRSGPISSLENNCTGDDPRASGSPLTHLYPPTDH